MKKGLFLFLLTVSLFAKNPVAYGFFSYNNTQTVELEIIGQVKSKTFSMHEKSYRLLDYDLRPMVLTSSLFSPEMVRPGDKVYILEKDPDHQRIKNGLIVAEAEIYSVFDTEFQGWMLRASGNLSMVRSGHFVAVANSTQERQDAVLLYASAKRELVRGNRSQAISLFRQSLQKDPGQPETYLQLALLSDGGARHENIREAWKRMTRFSQAEDLLSLPGLYVQGEMESLRDKEEPERLRRMVALLEEIRVFGERIQLYEQSFSGDVLEMLHTKGLPDTNFQYQAGRLYSAIHSILRENSVRTVVDWLTPVEREILYRDIFLPYRAEKTEQPKKSWDKAFLFAAIYHYELAHELSPDSGEAALSIVRLSVRELNSEIPENKREYFLDLLEHYGKHVLTLQSNPDEMLYVRNVLKRFNQF